MKRPPPGAGQLNSRKPADEVRTLIRDEFRKWGLDRDEYEIFPSQNRTEARVEFYLNGKRQVLTCSKSWTYSQNLHALWSILTALRLAHQRGILEELASAALAMLPAGPQHRDPFEVLGIRSDAPMEVVNGAYRALAARYHPDHGGSDGEMKELNEAYERVKTERASA
jgi:hypothetical protein